MQLTRSGRAHRGALHARRRQGQSRQEARSGRHPQASPHSRPIPTRPSRSTPTSLDANDAKKVAVFRGDVKAKQGGFVIRTPELQATYSGEAGLSDVAGTQPARRRGQARHATHPHRGQEESQRHLRRRPNRQRRLGDLRYRGQHSYRRRRRHALARKNVVRGTKLVIDMATGESTIETAARAANASQRWLVLRPGGPGGTPAQGRPSAVFYPDQLKEMRDGKPDAKPKKAPGAWDASTTPQSPAQGGN